MKARRRPSHAARVLRDLEAELAARDEVMLLTAARAAFNEALGAAPALPAPDEATPEPDEAGPGEPARRDRRLRFTATPPQVERMVIQNWKAEPGFIPIGDVELELDPGQEVTLWVNRGAPPALADTPEGEHVRSSLAILAEDEPLLA